MQVQEALTVPIKLRPKRTTPRYIIVKMTRVKDKENFKGSKRKRENYLQRSSHKSADLSKENLQARRAGKKYSKS